MPTGGGAACARAWALRAARPARRGRARCESSGCTGARRRAPEHGWAGVVAPVEEVGGLYCEDCHVAKRVEDASEVRAGVRGYALDPANAQALWALSEKMVGEAF